MDPRSGRPLTTSTDADVVVRSTHVGRDAIEEEPYSTVLDTCAHTGSVLAFTDLASPADFTHPTREYVTSR